ncbi:MAG: thioredoxin domain-containing protein [Candidatus Doudnabacteria bacterium]|nr:thioredoxin domain-containing protein [Candidatus Doudnabacteria bacterium]
MSDQSSAAPNWQKWILVLGVLAIVVALVVVVRVGKQQDSIQNQSADPFKGPEDAKVVVEEYSDFQCPACAGAAPVLSDIAKQFPEQVKVVYNDFPLTRTHRHAYAAAVAGQCADAQDGFWAWHDFTFAAQDDWSTVQDPTGAFTSYAASAGLDVDVFGECVKGNDTVDLVDEDIREGESLNISGTPTIFVNGERFVGDSYAILFDMVSAAVSEAYGQEALLPVSSEDVETSDGSEEGELVSEQNDDSTSETSGAAVEE